MLVSLPSVSVAWTVLYKSSKNKNLLVKTVNQLLLKRILVGGVSSKIQYINSAKKETSSHCQLSLFSANLTCEYLCEHSKIQQLRHKLNKFHRHVTNRNWKMCPWTNKKEQSVSGVATSCIKYCSASPLHGLQQICQFLLWDVTPLFHQGTCNLPDISGGKWP